MSEAPFQVGNYVKTTKGAKFQGRVVSVYRVDRVLEFIGMRQRDMELPPEWRADVMAVHPAFAGTIHVYPCAQLTKIADSDLDQAAGFKDLPPPPNPHSEKVE